MCEQSLHAEKRNYRRNDAWSRVVPLISHPLLGDFVHHDAVDLIVGDSQPLAPTISERRICYGAQASAYTFDSSLAGHGQFAAILLFLHPQQPQVVVLGKDQ
jgi:hypothetical protein